MAQFSIRVKHFLALVLSVGVLTLACGLILPHLHEDPTSPSQEETWCLCKIVEENFATLPISPIDTLPLLFIALCVSHLTVFSLKVSVVHPAFPRAPPILP